MIKRITKNWKTTAVALAILVVGGYCAVSGETTLKEASAFVIAILTLFFAKD